MILERALYQKLYIFMVMHKYNALLAAVHSNSENWNQSGLRYVFLSLSKYILGSAIQLDIFLQTECAYNQFTTVIKLWEKIM